LKEAISIAEESGVELHIIDEKKQRYRIFNRHPRRDNPQPIIRAADENTAAPTHEAPQTIQ
jgi:hypothetical protein